MDINNIKILLDNGNVLEYENDTSLSIKLNRIVDDLKDISKRYGEFSYTLTLPKTKNNRKCFEFPDVRGRRTEVFKGKSFGCQVFNNGILLLDGIIELSGFDSESYKCNFYSTYTQLLDSIKGKKLVDMTYFEPIVWQYETTIKNHIDLNLTSDHTDYQFPYVFYKTPFFSGATETKDTTNHLKAEDQFGYVYNEVFSSLNFGTKNPFFFERYPPAIYLKSIVKGIISDAGWSLGGTFFDHPSIKKIIIPFTGNAEDFSGAIITGSTTYLNLNKCLADIDQTTFLTSVINTFNLYFTIDPINRTISFETYNVLFNDLANPYDLTYKIDASSIVTSKADAETKLSFSDDDSNDLVMGYGRQYSYDNQDINELNPTYLLSMNKTIRTSIGKWNYFPTYDKNAFEKLFNKTTGDKEIKVAFSPANYFSYTIINERNLSGTIYSSAKYPTPAFTVGIPLMSDQTPTDNKDHPFANDGDDYCSGNGTANMEYPGKLKMLYYYGQSVYDFVLTGATSSPAPYNTYSFVSIARSGGTCSAPAYTNIKIPCASPFKLLSNYDLVRLKARMTGFTFTERANEIGAEAHYLLQTYFTNGTLSDVHEPTDFSLTFGDSEFQFDNIYSYFHKKKNETLRNSSVLTATMRMNALDWQEMQVSRPLSYDGEIYRLISIQNYDPIANSAKVTLLKV